MTLRNGLFAILISLNIKTPLAIIQVRFLRN
nr:MAG TPA: hypothetical protein [Caudoviricetes sp.]